MDDETTLLIVAGVVWLAFILAGLIGRPVKMSAIVSVGGGFLVGCVAAIATQIYLGGGILALVVIVVVMRFAWIVLGGLLSILIGR